MIQPRTTSEISLELRISDGERELLSRVQLGIAEIRIYKSGLYPSGFSIVLANDDLITIGLREVDLSPRFEVFPISVSSELFDVSADQVIDCRDHSYDLSIFLLSKAEWSVPTTPEDQAQLLGDPKGIHYAVRGAKKPTFHAMPLNFAVYDAGIELRGVGDWSFVVASSMFPFALYVSGCDFSEDFDGSIYDRSEVC